MNAEERRIYRFAGFSLDAAGGLLRNGSGDIALRPKSFDLLTYLVRNAGRVVSKSELMDAVWPNVTVTEDSLTRCIFDIRRALDDSGQMLVRTISRRGYLFSAEMLYCGDVVTMSMSAPEIASGESAAIVHRGSGVAAEPSEDGMPDEARHGRRMLQALVVESLSDSPVAGAQTGRFGSAEWVADHELRIRPTRSSGRARAAIAILPFSANAGAGEDCRPSMTADGLVYDVIRSLSRLRSILSLRRIPPRFCAIGGSSLAMPEGFSRSIISAPAGYRRWPPMSVWTPSCLPWRMGVCSGRTDGIFQPQMPPPQAGRSPENLLAPSRPTSI